jgi:predicted nucleic acid-binding protein
VSRIYWDTMLFAYILEGNPEFGQRTREAYEAITGHGDTICTSVFTVGEVLVKPKAVNDLRAYTAIRTFMRGGEVELLPFTIDIAEQYSLVRAQTKIKAADAIHLASAIRGRVDFLMTNDLDLRKHRNAGFPPMIGIDRKIY